jgi:hypothetical protein
MYRTVLMLTKMGKNIVERTDVCRRVEIEEDYSKKMMALSTNVLDLANTISLSEDCPTKTRKGVVSYLPGCCGLLSGSGSTITLWIQIRIQVRDC